MQGIVAKRFLLEMPVAIAVDVSPSTAGAFAWQGRGLAGWSENPVSSTRHIKRSMGFSPTTFTCTLHIKGYETYHAGNAFGDG